MPVRQKAMQLAASAMMTCSAILAPCSLAQAHEFWIDPSNFTPPINTAVAITFRIGSDFRGDTYPYVRSLDQGFGIIDSVGTRKPKTLDGDDPATEIKFTRPGLAIVWHRRAPETVTFETIARFEEILAEEGHEAVGEQHRKSGKPLKEIRENFSRYAKALIQVGGQGGHDRTIGLPLELVAESDPANSEARNQFTVKLLDAGQSLPGTLVKIFNADYPASSKRLRTDQNGRVTFDAAEPGEYLVSAVHMRPAAAKDKADWVSLWASLTFAVKK
ncbi:MAG: DUF4198 domain-containing protein [Hyphomicrobiaceae bacterium]|nr:DUF4198 domain-containing protein [Hyphomicrobiaceae bacterium]